MDKNKQKIEGNNNIQIGVHNGDIIYTEKVVRKTELIHDSDIYISDAQAKEIRDRIQKIAEEMAGEKRYTSAPYGVVYKSLYNRYKITKYTLLPKDKYEDAIKWLDKQIAIYRPKLKKVDPEQYRKDMYKSIHSKARELNFSHEELYSFINEYLNPKKEIMSLTELSDTRLKKIYTKLFSMK